MKKLVIILTVPISLETWFKGQAKYLSSYYEVEIITSSSNTLQFLQAYENVKITTVDFTRKINFIKDLKVLKDLFFYLHKNKPDIVYTLTPKAGLLGMLAAWLQRVPIRIHSVVGLPHMEATGVKKIILELTERMTYFCCTKLYTNSLNLKKYIQKYFYYKDIDVIGQGSANGVDVHWFCDTLSVKEKIKVRETLDILENDFVVTFIGRIVKDKGIDELTEVFTMLSQKFQYLKLLLIGDFEDELNAISEQSKNYILKNKNIIHVEFQEDIRSFLSITDLCVLPSYREGLPNVLIEAGSFGVPLLATDINGCNEVILDGVNGLLVEKKNKDALYAGIEKFISDTVFYAKVKSSARESIVQRYSQDYFWSALRNEFLKLEKKR